MRFLVFGAGAVGQWLGGTLARGGHEVVLVARPQVCQVVREEGLKVGGVLAPVQAVPAVASVAGNYDCLVLAVKAYDVEAALAEVEGRVQARRVLTVQDGVGTDERVGQALGQDRTVAGCVTATVTVLAPGSVQACEEGGVALAPLSPGQDLAFLAAALRQAGLRVAVLPDWRAMKWSRLLLAMLANASGALLDWTPDEVLRHRGLYQAEVRALREALKVMKARGLRPVNLPGFAVRLIARAARLPTPLSHPFMAGPVVAGRGNRRPLLLLDMLAGKKKSEVHYLNGAVVEEARPRAIPTPVNAFFTDMMLRTLAGALPWQHFRRRPDLLLFELKKFREMGRL
jgi:2-dehydropantoate 2-reductase